MGRRVPPAFRIDDEGHEEWREVRRIADERYHKDEARLRRNESLLQERIDREIPWWFRYAVCILEPLGIWAIFFLLLGHP
jgi:hypothetical protein